MVKEKKMEGRKKRSEIEREKESKKKMAKRTKEKKRKRDCGEGGVNGYNSQGLKLEKTKEQIKEYI